MLRFDLRSLRWRDMLWCEGSRLRAPTARRRLNHCVSRVFPSPCVCNRYSTCLSCYCNKLLSWRRGRDWDTCGFVRPQRCRSCLYRTTKQVCLSRRKRASLIDYCTVNWVHFDLSCESNPFCSLQSLECSFARLEILSSSAYVNTVVGRHIYKNRSQADILALALRCRTSGAIVVGVFLLSFLLSPARSWLALLLFQHYAQPPLRCSSKSAFI